MQASLALARQSGLGHGSDELDIGGLGRAIWRKKVLIAGLTLLAAGLAFLAVNAMTPRYKSEARVLIETRENIFLRPDAEKSIERSNNADPEAVTSQVQLILSRDLAREVIRKLKLAELPEFDPVLQGTSDLRVLLALIGLVKDPMSESPEERVLRNYFDRLSAYQVEKSRVIAIEFDSQDYELAAKVANTVAEGYLVMQQSVKLEQSRVASSWLAGEIDKLRTKVAEAEAKVEQYRATSNLFLGSNNTPLSNQQLSELNTQLSTSRAAKSDAEAKARLIRETLRSGAQIEFSDFVNSELLRRLSEQRVTLRAQLAEQSSTLLPRHPRIKELQAQIADLEGAMRTEADRLARAFESDAQLASARAESLSQNLDQLKRQASSTGEQDVQLRALDRDAKSQRDLLESYLAKYREATARDNLGAASPDARVISTAFVTNTPSWPKKLPTVLVAALGTFALTVGFVLTGQVLGAAGSPGGPAPAPISQDHVPTLRERAMPSPAMSQARSALTYASIDSNSARLMDGSRAGTADELRPSGGVSFPAIEEFARELTGAGEAGRRVTVVGLQRSISNTLSALSLARSLARHGRVVLMELAMDAPNLAAIASDPAAPGIGELVQGSASFGQIITRDRHSRVHMITVGRAPAELADVMASPQLALAMQALAQSYEYVVIDAGAMPQNGAERIAQFAPRAALIADSVDASQTVACRDRLVAAGFTTVSVLVAAPSEPLASGKSTRSAA